MFPTGTVITFTERQACHAFTRLIPERCFRSKDGHSVTLTAKADVIVHGGRDSRVLEVDFRKCHDGSSPMPDGILGGGGGKSNRAGGAR